MARPFLDAVAAQPANLRRSARRVRAALSEVDLDPWRAAPVVAVGMGASSHALPPLVTRLRSAHREAFAIDADEMIPPGALVAVSQGGASPETYEALAGRPLLPRLVVTNVPDSALGRLADAVIPLDLDEDSVAYTLGYTATLQALGLLADRLLYEEGDWDSLPEEVERMLDTAGSQIREWLQHHGAPGAVDTVGAGSTLAVAGEAALLLRETCRIPTGCFSTRQYLHGPMEAAEAGVAVVVIGDDREIDVARTVAAAGAATLLITAADVDPHPGVTVVRVGAGDPLARAVLEVLPVQLLAGHLASLRGLAIDGFRYEQTDVKLSAVPAPTAAIGIDVGGTKIAAALVTEDGRRTLHREAEVASTGGGSATLESALRLARAAAGRARDAGLVVSGVGLGLPELVSPSGRVLTSEVLPRLDIDEWIAALGEIAPVRAESDVRAAAVAEGRLGAGRGRSSFCYVSIGTGVSYCLVEHGIPRTGYRGAAILVGSPELLEEQASGPALRRRHRQLGGQELPPEAILARYGVDGPATAAVDEIGRELGIGIAGLINTLDPEAVVVGGGLGTAPGPLWEALVASAHANVWHDVLRNVPVVQAALGTWSGALGAALVGTLAAAETSVLPAASAPSLE